MALPKKSIGALPHFGPALGAAVDVEARCLLEIAGGRNADAEHIPVLAGNNEVVGLAVVVDHVDLLKVVLGQRVHLEDRSGFGPEQQHP